MKTSPDYEIVCDTREQRPWWTTAERVTLKTGDYSIKGEEDSFALERKSLPDFYQSLTSGHDRFARELTRATELRYFAIIVEGGYSDMAKKKWPNSWRTAVPGHVINSIANTLRVKYGIHVIYASSRVEAKAIARGLCTAYMKMIKKENKEK